MKFVQQSKNEGGKIIIINKRINLNQNLTRFYINQVYYNLIRNMNKQENQVNYVPSKYTKIFSMYTKNYMKWINPFLNCISKSCQYGAKYPIFKVLKAISKIFLLNEIQIIFLAYMIKETDWDIKEKLITNNLQLIKDVVCCSNDQPEYKSLILYLMIVSYSVKFYLNEETKDVMEQANKICPNFKAIFQNWAKKHASLTKRINPKTLNRVYQKLVEETRKQEPDFNMIVDAIIQISPAYNPEKNEMKKKQYAEIKKQPVKKVKNENLIIVTNSGGATNGSSVNPLHEHSHHHHHEGPTFSSSALYDIATHAKNAAISHQVALNSMNIFKQPNISLNKSANFLGSSFVGIPKEDIRDRLDEQEICESFILNLKEGQSEENIIIQQDLNEEENGHHPHTSVINLQRGVSATEKYWAQDPDDRHHH